MLPNKVIITGALHKQIFFVADDDIVRHMGEDLPFTTFVDLPGIDPGDSVTVNPVVEHVSFELIDPTCIAAPADDFEAADPYVEEPESPTFRRLIQRTVIQLVVRGSEETPIRIATAPIAPTVVAGICE